MIQTFVIFGDPHGDKANPRATEALFNFMDDFRPDIVVNAGDNWNFDYLRAKASAKEENSDSSEDWKMGSEFFLRAMSYGKRRFFLRGNHDERVWDSWRNATKESVRIAAEKGIRDIEKLVTKRRVTMLPYDSREGVLDVDGLRVIHGYSSGIGAALRFARVYGDCAYAHTHSMDVAPAEKWPSPSVAYGTGCLMNVDQPYNSRNMGKLRHENGFLSGFVKDGRATFFQAKLHPDGFVYASTEIKGY
jgi:predicted phosphodiesterase